VEATREIVACPDKTGADHQNQGTVFGGGLISPVYVMLQEVEAPVPAESLTDGVNEYVPGEP
jgi:hypothetical protein